MYFAAAYAGTVAGTQMDASAGNVTDMPPDHAPLPAYRYRQPARVTGVMSRFSEPDRNGRSSISAR
jgi:hypothetical protein